MHTAFESGLVYLTLQKATGLLSLVKKQIIASYNNSNKEQENHREVIKRQILEVQKKIDRLEERLNLKEITLDLYNKYLPKFKLEIIDLERALLKTSKRV